MPYDPALHHRRSIRLAGYDYASAGVYFVTLCAAGRACLYGEIAAGEMRPNARGEIVAAVWESIPARFPAAELGEWALMPNHLHGIIMLTRGVGAKDREGGGGRAAGRTLSAALPPPPSRSFAPTDATRNLPAMPHGAAPGSLAAIVQNTKSLAARRIHALPDSDGREVIWQRGYYEHIIRSARELDAIRQYILNNPAQWALDTENPERW